MNFMSVVKSLLSSKKVVSAVVGVCAILAVRFIPGLEAEQATEIGREIMVIVGGLLVGQGLTDQGKAGADIVSETERALSGMSPDE